ncbi:hypothetical protein FPV67DRAFT_1447465 [Lyophyllum atratum]|nr:hypothetical protein FPV67DRAFT_1447465 [Lyophyllum atratum]
MSSLHSLQTATINASGGGKTRQTCDMFTQIRQSLHREWEGIIQVLRRCCDFSGKATCILESRDSFGDEEFADYIRELITLAGELFSSSQAMFSLHRRITSEVIHLTPRITPFLQHSSKAPQLSVSQSRLQQLKATHMPEKPDVHDFVQSNLQAAYPDGLVALGTTTAALHETSLGLSMVSQFWSSIHEDHKYLMRDDSQPPNFTQDP